MTAHPTSSANTAQPSPSAPDLPSNCFKRFSAGFRRHVRLLAFIFTEILPATLRTGKRPVMFVRYGGIGDMLSSFPAAAQLMSRHPGAAFFYHCPPDLACLLGLAGLNVRIFSARLAGPLHYRYGWLLGGYYKFDYIDEDPKVCSTEILIQEFAHVHGVEVSNQHPPLKIPPETRSRVQAMLQARGLGKGPLVIIHAGPSWPVREWPREHWASLVQKLRQARAAQIVQLGVGGHANLARAEVPDIPGVLRLVDCLTVEEMIALISLADLFVGIDSGPLHIAASVGAASVSVWGPTAPRLRFAPAPNRAFLTAPVECLGCHHRYPRLHWVTGCPYDIRCMKSVSVDDVLAACLSHLKP